MSSSICGEQRPCNVATPRPTAEKVRKYGGVGTPVKDKAESGLQGV